MDIILVTVVTIAACLFKIFPLIAGKSSFLNRWEFLSNTALLISMKFFDRNISWSGGEGWRFARPTSRNTCSIKLGDIYVVNRTFLSN